MADPSFGRVGIYIGETSRSLSERTTEHFNDAESFSKKSAEIHYKLQIIRYAWQIKVTDPVS